MAQEIFSPSGSAFEKHYRVKDLAELWGFSKNTIRKLFVNEPGVICLGKSSDKREYCSLSIPESVALRVHERLGNNTLKPRLTRRHPLRVIRLRDLNAGVRKKPGNVLQRDAAQKHSYGEGVA